MCHFFDEAIMKCQNAGSAIYSLGGVIPTDKFDSGNSIEIKDAPHKN